MCPTDTVWQWQTFCYEIEIRDKTNAWVAILKRLIWKIPLLQIRTMFLTLLRLRYILHVPQDILKIISTYITCMFIQLRHKIYLLPYTTILLGVGDFK